MAARFEDTGFRKRAAWSCIDARDLGQITDLAIKKDGMGFQVFNAANNETSCDVPTRELIERFIPGTPVNGELGEFESLLSNNKTREVLGFKEQHRWRQYVPGY